MTAFVQNKADESNKTPAGANSDSTPTNSNLATDINTSEESTPAAKSLIDDIVGSSSTEQDGLANMAAAKKPQSSDVDGTK
jgi:hypothetical protein